MALMSHIGQKTGDRQIQSWRTGLQLSSTGSGRGGIRNIQIRLEMILVVSLVANQGKGRPGTGDKLG